MRTGISLDPNFGREFVQNDLKHQHELKSIYPLSRPFDQCKAANLSFFKYIRNRTRWDNKRVFQIDNNDLRFFLSL